MFKNKTTILLTLGILIAIAVGLQFVNDKEREAPDMIRAVPKDAAIVVESENLITLLRKFNRQNQFKLEFSDFELWEDFFVESENLDSIIRINKGLKSIFEGNHVVVSGHISADSRLEFLFVIPFNEEKQHQIVKNAIASLDSGRVNLRKRMYEKQTIYDISSTTQDPEKIGFSYSIVGDLLVCSRSKILTEDAVRTLNSGHSISMDKGFVSMAKTAGKNADLNLYINYSNLPFTLKNILTEQQPSFYNFFKEFASWSEFDLTYKNDAFLMSGFTHTDDSLPQLLSVFKEQSAVHNDFLSALPGNTAAFIAYNLSDVEAWSKKHDKFLERTSRDYRIDQRLSEIDKKFDTDIKQLFFENIENAIVSAWINKDAAGEEVLPIAIIGIKDAELMKEKLKEIRSKDSTSQTIERVPIEKYKATYFSYSKVLYYIFGDIFSGFNANYYIIHNSNLVFAEDVNALQLYVRKVKSGSRLLDSREYIDYSKSLSTESNLFVYLNPSASKSLASKRLNYQYKTQYQKSFEKFSKIQAISIQFGVARDKVFTNLYANFNPLFRKKNKNVWELQLDTTFSMKPELVFNHYTNNKEVIFQDDANELILVSEKGTKLWNKKIEGKILGQIHQIDKYKNNKLQYIFNTQRKLYLVDRNGKDVDGFPITFKSPSTNGIAVFDYDNDKDYRILVACANKSIYLLNADGGKVEGWQFKKTKGIVKQPAQHFLSKGKDYIVFADETNTYIVNRRGDTRVEPKSEFNKSRNTLFYFEEGESDKDDRFVTTSTNGDVYFIFTDGVVKKMSFGQFSSSHQFIYDDIDGNGKKQFVFADKNILTVYNRDKSVRFERKFENILKNSLNLYLFDKKSRFLGVSPANVNKIYLVAPDGENVKGFPMHGDGAFSISKIDRKDSTNTLNLITGDSESFLFNYRISEK